MNYVIDTNYNAGPNGELHFIPLSEDGELLFDRKVVRPFEVIIDEDGNVDRLDGIVVGHYAPDSGASYTQWSLDHQHHLHHIALGSECADDCKR